ncbi:hypothetical protein EGW08_016079 [Elysia chlorotica]|uniref:Uncharacterized protein n=1 Tax=Elysia chlorotica TaxID=188477 RepID=A0A3S0ZF51_ELYCH|nr:hypothetical protein EGW08_016079 [Elysia chlorotica]
MRRRAALKLAGLACAASLVALILVSNTREHPRVTCTGHTCDEPFLKSPKDFSDRETSKNAESRFSPSQYTQNDFASGQDIFGRSTGNPGVGDLAQARTGVTVGANAGKVLDLTQFLQRNTGKEQIAKVEGHLHGYGGEEKGVHPGKEPNETVQDHLHGNVGQENGISAGKEEGVKVEGHLRGNADQEKEINVEASDKPMGDHVTDRAKSYLEKLGVIKNLGEGARPLKSRKDLYSWRLKAPGAGNRNPAEQAPGTAQKVQISNKTGSVSGPERNGTAKIGAESTVSGDGSLGGGFGHLRDGSLQTGVAAAERATTNKAESAAGKQAGLRATNDDTNAVRDVNSQGKDAGSVKDSVGAAESSNAQNPQSILRAAAAPAENPTSPAQGAGANSTEADPRNTSVPVLGKPSRPVGNSSVNNKDTAKSGGADSRSPTHRPGETVGNLLQRAGVITDQTNQTRGGEGEEGAAVAAPVGSDSAKSDPDTDRRKVCPEFTGGQGMSCSSWPAPTP